jgi:NAD(P)-dependent dehydrogenase (short-subunit alcohol dehydrogenase family)
MTGASPLPSVINAGASSLKFAACDGEALLLSGQVDGIGIHPGVSVREAYGEALRRLVTIEEIGTACVFLASPYADAMTGETLYIDGRYHILA